MIKLVIHNAPFDIKFLNHELSVVNKPPLNLADAIDTLILARKKFPGARVNLDALCRRYKIDNSARQFHGALKDAALLAEVYVELSGGRQASFTIANSRVTTTSSGSNADSTPKGNGIIISPTKEEKEKHKEFIDSNLG